ncbi:hypothetical protein NMY22_g8334 [Coprinellus aureogranulatus]|nr:hypothetical protein NMY22_g8334 [Coprinellus aureogranulatus]
MVVTNYSSASSVSYSRVSSQSLPFTVVFLGFARVVRFTFHDTFDPPSSEYGLLSGTSILLLALLLSERLSDFIDLLSSLGRFFAYTTYTSGDVEGGRWTVDDGEEAIETADEDKEKAQSRGAEGIDEDPHPKLGTTPSSAAKNWIAPVEPHTTPKPAARVFLDYDSEHYNLDLDPADGDRVAVSDHWQQRVDRTLRQRSETPLSPLHLLECPQETNQPEVYPR